MKKIYLPIMLVTFALTLISCDVLNSILAQFPIILKRELSYDQDHTVASGIVDIGDDPTYKDLKKNLDSNKIISRILLKTLIDNSATTEFWTSQTSGINHYLQSVYFADTSNGWAVGGKHTILKTANGGATWVTQYSGPAGITENDLLMSVYFINTNVGWASGNRGTILKTINGGATWTPQTSGTQEILYSICFLNENIGYAVGQNYTVVKTTNGGTNWFKPCASGGQNITSCSFIDANNGWLVTANGSMQQTTNGGVTWLHNSGSLSFSLFSVYFKDLKHGWAAGYQGIMHRTTDGGLTWDSKFITQPWLYSVYFVDVNNGWTVGGNVVLKTTNGGVTWKSINNNPKIMTSVYFTDLDHGWMVGEAGLISRYSKGGKFDLDVEFYEATDTTKILYRTTLKDKKMSDWKTNPLVIQFNNNESTTITEYLKKNERMGYRVNVSKKDYLEFDFKLELQICIVLYFKP